MKDREKEANGGGVVGGGGDGDDGGDVKGWEKFKSNNPKIDKMVTNDAE